MLSVHVVLIETSNNWLLLWFRAGAVDVSVVLDPLLLQVGGAAGIGGVGGLPIIGGGGVGQVAGLLLVRARYESANGLELTSRLLEMMTLTCLQSSVSYWSAKLCDWECNR